MYEVLALELSALFKAVINLLLPLKLSVHTNKE